MKRIYIIIFLIISLFVLAGCSKDNGDSAWKSLSKDEQALYFINEFGYNMVATYYLWNEEIKSGLSTWTYDTDPIKKVREIMTQRFLAPFLCCQVSIFHQRASFCPLQCHEVVV